MSGIDWERVESGLERERHRMIWRPYGLPEVVDPERSAFFDAWRSEVAANDKVKKQEKEARLARIDAEKSRTRILKDGD